MSDRSNHAPRVPARAIRPRDPLEQQPHRSGVGKLIAMRPGGRLLPRPALHRVLDHLQPGAFLEGDLPRPGLLGRADRDVVEGAAVGMAGRDYKGRRDAAAACTTVRRWHYEPRAIVLNGR